MRDVLTIIAGILILILLAALAVPPFVPWESFRGQIDAAVARAAGTEARTEGAISVRLLPTPRLRFERLRIGATEPNSPSLSASFVRTEIALPPLLRGEVRFQETRVGRAEIRLPSGAEGDWHVSPALLADESIRRDFVFESLGIRQLLVTTVDPRTGRTDQFFSEDVRIQGQSLAGPWRIDGTTAGVTFQIATGELTPERTMQVKLAGGGDLKPHIDVDARIAFEPDPAGGLVPKISGTTRILFGPPSQAAAAGFPIPVALQSNFKLAGTSVALDGLSVEAGQGAASLRLGGTGRIDLAEPRMAVALEGRRIDLDSFILSASGREIVERIRTWRPKPSSFPIDLSLKLDSIGLAQDELTDLQFRASFFKGRGRIERFEVTGPGQTRILAEGEVGVANEAGANGRLAIASQASDKLARYLDGIGVSGPALQVLDGRPLEAAADFSFASPVTAFRNMRVRLGDARMTGALRYTAAESGARGRLEAQIALQGLDLKQLPQVSGIFQAGEGIDFGIILDARDVGYGTGPSAGKGGRIAARISSDGRRLLVDRLEIADLAGANASVSGQITPDGMGRIEGHMSAPQAAPLIDLIGRVWIGNTAALVPAFLREGDLDLAVTAERVPDGRSPIPLLRTTLRGKAAGGRFDADIRTAGGETQSIALNMATDNTGIWVDRPSAPGLRSASTLELRGAKLISGQFTFTVAADLGGVKVTTTRPFAFGFDQGIVESGEADIRAADITPFLVLLGDGAGVTAPVPAELHLSLGRERDTSELRIGGRLSGEAIEAQVAAASLASVVGTVTLDRLSMPWLTAAFALNAPVTPPAGSLWPTARFGQTRRLVSGGQIVFKAKRVELGRGYVAQNGAMRMTVTPEGISVRELDLPLAGGRITGGFAVSRQGSQASLTGDGELRGLSLPALTGSSALNGRLSGKLRFGASGENVASLIANIAGSGDLSLDQVEVARADPAGIDRALTRVLKDSDPLGNKRLGLIVEEELNRAPFKAAKAGGPATLIGGVVRVSPVNAKAEAGTWQGSVSYDLKTLALDARGQLQASHGPLGWSGATPYINLGWRGLPGQVTRDVDVGPLTNGIAAIVLQRELDRIDSFKQHGNGRSQPAPPAPAPPAPVPAAPAPQPPVPPGG